MFGRKNNTSDDSQVPDTIGSDKAARVRRAVQDMESRNTKAENAKKAATWGSLKDNAKWN
jgi:hypothetical protein